MHGIASRSAIASEFAQHRRDRRSIPPAGIPAFRPHSRRRLYLFGNLAHESQHGTFHNGNATTDKVIGTILARVGLATRLRIVNANDIFSGQGLPDSAQWRD
jgi:hypothetical protein